MKNINANIAALEEKIEKLRTLQGECESIDVSANELVGSGMSVQVIEAIDQEYTQVKDTIVSLLSNSIEFFQNVKASLVEADEKAANKLN